MGVLNEIAAQLATLGVGTVGTTIHLGVMPETPDVCTSVFETGGLAPEFSLGTSGLSTETPAIQVVCRGAKDDYATPRANARLAYEGLPKVEAETLSGGGTSAFYYTIHPQQAPFLSQRDANGRVYISCNYLCEKELSST